MIGLGQSDYPSPPPINKPITQSGQWEARRILGKRKCLLFSKNLLEEIFFLPRIGLYDMRIWTVMLLQPFWFQSEGVSRTFGKRHLTEPKDKATAWKAMWRGRENLVCGNIVQLWSHDKRPALLLKFYSCKVNKFPV